MKIEDLADKKILILGFGVEGRSTLRFLNHFFPDKKIGVADQKDGPDYLDAQKNYNCIIRSPGIPRRLVIGNSTTMANIFFANVRGTTIGITGTKGKSTTASLVYAMLRHAGLRAHLVGNIGNPMLDELVLSNTIDDIWVVELSSYQLEDINYSPHISLILNFFPDHMDYHGGVDNYWNAKKNIVRYAMVNDFFVFNSIYFELASLAQETKAHRIAFDDAPYQWNGVSSLLGEHNKENIRAAVAIAKIVTISDRDIQEALKTFKALAHRLERVGEYHNIIFYDDAISTTPESTICAIKSLSPIGTIFLGGYDRGYDFRELAQLLRGHAIPNIVFFPESGKNIKQALEEIDYTPEHILETRDMRTAVAFAYTYTPQHSICLLSCASPSYSIWNNFEEKGNLFQRAVKEYADTHHKAVNHTSEII